MRVVQRLRAHAARLVRGRARGDALLTAAFTAWLAPGVAIDLPSGLRALYAAYAATDCQEDAPTTAVLSPVAAALDALPHPHRSLVLLQQMEGLDAADTAFVLGLSEAAHARVAAEAWRRLAFALPRSTDVLVIEDEPVTALELSEIVADLGMRVIPRTATGAGPTRPTPGLVLADLRLGRDPLGGSRRLQQLTLPAHTPIVFVTGYPDLARQQVSLFPAARVIAKPFQPLALKLAILDALSAAQASPVRPAAGGGSA